MTGMAENVMEPQPPKDPQSGMTQVEMEQDELPF